MAESIWYADPWNFITADNFWRIIPIKGMQSYAEQLNAVLRLAVYYAVVISVVRQDLHSFLVPIFVGAVTFFLYKSFKARGFSAEPISGTGNECVVPTKQNPFMNVLGADDRKRSPACDPLSPAVKQRVDETFTSSMFYDVDDVWSRNNASRNFYTTASTTVPNDQTGFAEWLYGGVRAGGKQTRPPRNAIF